VLLFETRLVSSSNWQFDAAVRSAVVVSISKLLVGLPYVEPRYVRTGDRLDVISYQLSLPSFAVGK